MIGGRANGFCYLSQTLKIYLKTPNKSLHANLLGVLY